MHATSATGLRSVLPSTRNGATAATSISDRFNRRQAARSSLGAPTQTLRLPHTPSVLFWIITPEDRPEQVIRALRRSWMRGAAVRFAVAPDATGRSANRNVHVLDMEMRSDIAPTLAGRTGAIEHPRFACRRSKASLRTSANRTGKRVAGSCNSSMELATRNLFLRQKVMAMIGSMCAGKHLELYDYHMLLDDDTAVNQTNLIRFLGSQPQLFTAKNESVYMGFCGKRQTCVGGGPGVLLSSGLLAKTCPRLHECRMLAASKAYDKREERVLKSTNEFRGGDRWLCECLSMLHRDLKPTCLGCEHTGRCLFRPHPPWVPAWATDAVKRHPHGLPIVPFGRWKVDGSATCGSRRQCSRSWASTAETVSFHRVNPSMHDRDLGTDPRCSIWFSMPVGNQTTKHALQQSQCAPHFTIVGVPKSGTTSLFNYLVQHPEIRAKRKELHYFMPIARPADRLVVDDRVRAEYMSILPVVDPRDFQLTGEASPAYLYHPGADALFLEHLRTTRVIVMLREPCDRTFSEFKNKCDNKPEGSAWTHGICDFEQLTAQAHGELERCGLAALYKSQEARAWAHNGANATREIGVRNQVCTVPPVIFQSWYHLHLPRWLLLGPRLHVEHFDDLEANAQKMMRRVAAFLQLTASEFRFATETAYNTEKRRGANIANKTPKGKSGVGGGSNDNSMPAEGAVTSRSNMSQAQRLRLQLLTHKSVVAASNQLVSAVLPRCPAGGFPAKHRGRGMGADKTSLPGNEFARGSLHKFSAQ